MNKKKYQKGLSLIESAMVLALSSAVIAGVLFYYNYAKEKNEINEGVSQLQTIVSAMNRLYTNGSSSTLTNTSGGVLTDSMKAVSIITGISTINYNDGSLALKSPVGTGIKLYGVDKGTRQYRIAVQPKNVSSCIAYATLNLGTAMYQPPVVISANGNMSGDINKIETVTAASTICKSIFQNNESVGQVIFYMRY